MQQRYSTTQRRRKTSRLSERDRQLAEQFIGYARRHLGTVNIYLSRARRVVGDNPAGIWAVTKLFVKLDVRLEPRPEPGGQCPPLFWMLAAMRSDPTLFRAYILLWLQEVAP